MNHILYENIWENLKFGQKIEKNNKVMNHDCCGRYTWP